MCAPTNVSVQSCAPDGIVRECDVGQGEGDFLPNTGLFWTSCGRAALYFNIDLKAKEKGKENKYVLKSFLKMYTDLVSVSIKNELLEVL